MTFKEVVGYAINAGVSSAFKSGLISIVSNATGAPIMEMALVFGFMYLPDMPQDTKSKFFDPPDESFF